MALGLCSREPQTPPSLCAEQGEVGPLKLPSANPFPHLFLLVLDENTQNLLEERSTFQNTFCGACRAWR